jgi:mannose-6-phosphate isomerase
MQSSGKEIVGASAFEAIQEADVPGNLRGRFPLLFKYLDANQNLSVQVHPDDEMAARLPTPDLGKTEAWYVMLADPDAKIYAGLKAGVSADDFRAAINKGRILDTLHSFDAQPGDCIFIPAGTIHAIGAGLLVAEIQQASNTTFRVYDWDRLDTTGNSRPLHIEQAIQAIDFSTCPVKPVCPRAANHANAEILVDCEKFQIHRWSTTGDPVCLELGNDDSFHVLMVTRGSIKIHRDNDDESVLLGQTILLPACMKSTTVELQPKSEFLQIFLPEY